MEIIFIRHGEQNYTPCSDKGFMGHGFDLAPLTPKGIKQAEEVSKNILLNNSELIISSPYTRALQTAAIISKNIQLDIIIEIDLHEFLIDKTFQYKSKEESDILHKDFRACQGIYPVGETRRWETIEEIKNRTLAAIKKYLTHKKIIVVAHLEVIRRFTGIAEVKYCTPYTVNFDDAFNCFDWV